MRLGITTASLGRSARSAADVRLRQPLARARVNVATQRERNDLLELADVLAEEINVKELEVVSEVGELVNYKVLPNNRLLGPKFGKEFPAVRQALLALDPAQVAGKLQAEGEVSLMVNGRKVTLNDEEVVVQTESRGGLAVASDKGVTVAVDIELTSLLVQEGYARDLVRAINNLRKEAGLEISDRIELTYQAGGEAAAALENFADYVKQETLAVSLATSEMDGAAVDHTQQTLTIGDQEVVVRFRKASP